MRMSNDWRRSAWRDDERWQARLASDRDALAGRLSAEQSEALDELVAQFEAEDELRLSFVIVFGSQARGEADEESDLDIYAEANIPRPRGFSIPDYDVMINPNGTLMGGANRGFEMSNDVIRDARIWHDDGSFRSLLIWLDEEEA
jgi:Nucleotidyltransferase domain